MLGDEGDLAEILTRPEAPDLATVDADLDLAVGDHEELVARRTLLDPIERGRFLLTSYGGAEREKPVRKREFQSEVMELDETAARARREGDSARLASVVLEAEEKLASAIMAAGQSFTRLERAFVEELGAAADALAEARLWRQKVDELRAKLGG